MENNIENRYVPVEEYIEQQLPDSSLIRAERLRDVLKYIYANTEGGGGGSPEVINAIIKQVFGGTNVPEVQDELGSPSILDHLKKGITPKYVTLPQGVSISTYITGESSNVNSTIEVLNNELIYIREYYKTDTNVDVYDGQKVYVLIKGPGKYGKPLTGNTKPVLRSDFGLISDGLVVQGQGGGSAVKSVEDTSPDARGNISLLKKVVRWEDSNINDDQATFNMVPAVNTSTGKTKFIPRDSFEGKVKSVNRKEGDVILKTSDLENDSDYTTNATLTAHASDKANPHNVTKSQIGLGNIDNTSDINKPISTATQTELNKKLDKPTTNNTNQFVILGDGSTAPKSDFGKVDTVNNIAPYVNRNINIGLKEVLSIGNEDLSQSINVSTLKTTSNLEEDVYNNRPTSLTLGYSITGFTTIDDVEYTTDGSIIDFSDDRTGRSLMLLPDTLKYQNVTLVLPTEKSGVLALTSDIKIKTINSKSPDSAGNVDIGIDDTLRVNDVTERVIEFEDGGINLDVIDEEGLVDKKFFAYSIREKGIFRIGTGCGHSTGWSAPTFFGWGSLKKLNRNNATGNSSGISAYGFNSLTAFEGGNNGGITSIGSATLSKFVGTNDPLPSNSYFMTALGVNALYDFLNGSRNTALGGSSGRRLVTGSNNTFTGAASMQALEEGSNNTAIGYRVTATLKKGSNNTFIGANLQLVEEEVNDTVIIADGTGKQHFKSDNSGSTLPSQTVASINADETGKAIITKEFIAGNLSGPEQILEIQDFYNEMERQARVNSNVSISSIAHQLNQNTKGPLQYINDSYYDITIENGAITYEDTGKRSLTLEKLPTQGFKVDLTGVLVKVFDPNYPEKFYLSRTTGNKTIAYNDINSFSIEEVFTGNTLTIFDYLPAPVTPRVKLINDYLLAGKSFSSGPWEYAVIGKVISTGEMIPDFYYQVSGYVTLIDLSKYDIPKEDIEICFISTVNGTEGPWQPVIGDSGGAA